MLKLSLAICIAITTLPATSAAACRPGVYRAGESGFVVLGAPANPAAPAQRYLFRDGSRGMTGEAGSPVACDADVATVTLPGEAAQRWPRENSLETDASFESAATKLAGRLIEPPGAAQASRPLVVLVHGSEKTSPLESVYAYMLVAQGVSVFVYDKRGTGASGGEYTQNFELLADDAAAALKQARAMSKGRHGRAGYFGGSQGGWVAPLAATRSAADFVAVGFGLVVSPIEEDHAQLLDEAREMHLDAADLARVDRLSRATARLVSSHFTSGYEELAKVRREIGDAPWATKIKGEHSGDMLRMSEAELRRVGRARFDNVELIWDYDAVAVLRKLPVPLLWVLAAEDREAPIAKTRSILSGLVAEGKKFDVYLFPDTDHGMFEFRVNEDGSRTATRITDGYLGLLADWIKQDVRGPYGRGKRVDR
jgi:dienelactone hydrolase